jgi:hypothetical protein
MGVIDPARLRGFYEETIALTTALCYALEPVPKANPSA